MLAVASKWFVYVFPIFVIPGYDLGSEKADPLKLFSACSEHIFCCDNVAASCVDAGTSEEGGAGFEQPLRISAVRMTDAVFIDLGGSRYLFSAKSVGLNARRSDNRVGCKASNSFCGT
jgi:hypothetical protein